MLLNAKKQDTQCKGCREITVYGLIQTKLQIMEKQSEPTAFKSSMH